MADNEDITWDAPQSTPPSGAQTAAPPAPQDEDITWDQPQKADAISIHPVDDHGLAQRQQLSPLGKALSPITSYWPNVKQFENEGLEQASHGLKQLKDAQGAWDVIKGAGNAALGTADYLSAPISGAYRSIVGQPIEDVTGIPREYSEFAAQLATPGIGLASAAKSKPAIPTIPKPVDPFGVTLTQGEQTGDLAARQFEQGALRAEHGEGALKQASDFFNVQRPQQLQQAKQDISASLANGQQLAETPQEAGSIVQSALQSAAARDKAQVKAAYDYAKSLPGEIKAEAFTNMPENVKSELYNNPDGAIVVDDKTPQASRMIDYLNEKIGQLKIPNAAQPTGTGLTSPGTPNIVGVNLQGIEQWRKSLSRMRGDALTAYHTNATDARAAQAIMDAFDKHIDAAVNSGMFSGDPDAVSAWNAARALHAQRMRTWGNDAVGRRLRAIIGDVDRDPATLNDVTNWLYGESGSSNSLNVATIKRIKNILGENSPEFGAIRQGLFHRLVSVAEGQNERGPGAIANRLDQFLGGKGSDLAGAIYTPAQQDLLRAYSDLHRTMQIPTAGANWSGTAGKTIPYLKYVGDKIISAIGATIGHHIAPGVGDVAGWMAGQKAAQATDKFAAARNTRQAVAQMPLVAQRLKQWQKAVAAQQRNNTIASRTQTSLTAANLATALNKLGVDSSSFTKLLTAGPSGPSDAQAQQLRAKGGKVKPNLDNTDTLADQMLSEAADFADAKKFADGGTSRFANFRRSDDIEDRRDQELTIEDLLRQPEHAESIDTKTLLKQYPRNPLSDALGAREIEEKLQGYADGGTPTFDDRFNAVNDPPTSDPNQTEQATDDSWKDREAQAGLQYTQPENSAPSDSAWDWVKNAASSVYGATKRFSQYDRQMTENILNAPKYVYEHPQEALEKGKELIGLGDKDRYQTWPERMIRSGASLPHDVMTGSVPVYEIDPTTGEPHTSSEMISRAQDLSGMAGSGGLGGVEEDAARAATAADKASSITIRPNGEGLTSQDLQPSTTLGSGPFLRPALKYEGKIYKAPPGGQHLDAIPKSLQDTFQQQALSGDDISNFNFGFMNHKGQFLNRDQALDYAVKEGMLDPRDAQAGTLTSTMNLRSDSSEPGAALSALEHAEPFYSQVEKTIQSAPQSKMQGVQWANWLKNQPGVKPDELQWGGFDNWLRDQKGAITKDQVLDQFNQNKIQLNNVVKGQGMPKFEDLTNDQHWDVLNKFNELNDHEPTAKELKSWYENIAEHSATLGFPTALDKITTPTKYQNWQLPGGENYREHLITLPNRNTVEPRIDAIEKQINELYARKPRNREAFATPEDSDKFYELNRERNALIKQAEEQNRQNYKSGHWDEPNILAHVRTNERDVGGVPSLHLEEIQSDWGAAYRKKAASIIADHIDRNFDDVAAKMVKDGVIKKECD